MNFNRRPLGPASLCLFAILLASLPGCTQVQVAPNTLGEYKFGELHVVADRSFAATYEAAKRGVKDANLFLTGDDRRAMEAELSARDAADARVVIKVKQLAPDRASVRIRYGVPGNLALAQQLYQTMQRSL